MQALLKANRDFPHNCQLCLQDVGGSPSVGKATDEKDARGYTGEILPTTQQQYTASSSSTAAGVRKRSSSSSTHTT